MWGGRFGAKSETGLYNLGNSLQRRGEALEEGASNSLIIDGTIQRIEFSIELYWKTLKRLLSVEGIETNTPREVLKEAYSAGWLQNETAWLQFSRFFKIIHKYYF